MSACGNPHMRWEREGRWHQVWIQIWKMCMKEQEKTQNNLILQHRKVWCSFSIPLQMGFSALKCKHHVLLQITWLSGDHHLAGRLKPICRIGAPQSFTWQQQLPLCSAAALTPPNRPWRSFPGHAWEMLKISVAGAVSYKKESRISKACKWPWDSSKHLLSDIIAYTLVSLLRTVSGKACTLQGHLYPKRNLQN